MSGTYIYLRESGIPYYVGKYTKPRRAFSGTHFVSIPKDKSRILIQEFPSEEDAFYAERFLIACYGREDNGTGCLLNFTDGGEGMAGHIVLPETRQKIRAAMLGK